MWPFGGGDKGKKKAPRYSRERVPTGRVITLSSQGMSEPEIIQNLKREGYTPLQVDQAMKEALKTSVGSTGPGAASVPPAPSPLPSQTPPPPPGLPPEPADEEADFGPPSPPREMRAEDVPGIPPLPTEVEMPAPPSESPVSERLAIPEPAGFDSPLPGEEMVPRLKESMTKREAKEEKRRSLEELAEAIIEEKWMGIREEIMNLKSQVQDTGFKIASVEQSMKKIEGDKKTDMEQIEDKIDTYKQCINEVSARMESIEKAMKDSLTPMMQSLRSLTETIKTMKDKKAQTQ